MPLKGEAKKEWSRNYCQKESVKRQQRRYNRTRRYGNWRQLYHDRLGMCEICGAVDNLEIHEETDGISVIEYKLWCVKCHVKHEKKYNLPSLRKYSSKLSEDINAEILEYGGLENWKKAFMIKEKNG